MRDYIFCCVLILLSHLNPAQSYLEKEICDRISNVEIRYKDYYDVYLQYNEATQSVGNVSAFYVYITSAVEGCCQGMPLNFTRLNSSKSDIEESALNALPTEDNTSIPRPFVFYFPEFAANKEKIVYDFELTFVKLARSPGQALLMLTPESKQKVSFFHIFKESGAMLATMLTMSWFVGILGWITVS